MVKAKAEGPAVWVSLAASVPGLGVETCLWKHCCPALPAGGVCPTPLSLVRAAVPDLLPSSPILSLCFTNPAAAGVSEHFTESGQSLMLNDNRISPKLYMTLALKANVHLDRCYHRECHKNSQRFVKDKKYTSFNYEFSLTKIRGKAFRSGC